MAIIYCSNQPGGTNGYGVGSDASVDPSNKATPYLTANVALDDMGNNDTVIFNDGDYVYSAGTAAGRLLLGLENSGISCENSYATKLTFSGSDVQGLRLNSNSSQIRTVTLGPINISGSNDKQQLVTLASNGSTHAKMILNSMARFVDLPENIGLRPITVSGNGANIDVNIMAGSAITGTLASGQFRGITLEGLDNNSNINIDELTLDITGEFVPSAAAVNIGYSIVSGGSVDISGITGQITDTLASNTRVYAVNVTNAPSGATIHDCNDLTVTASGAGRSGVAFTIQSPAGDSLSANDAVIENNTNVQVVADSGFLATIGEDGGSLHNCDNGIIRGNTMAGNGNTAHGICHFGTPNGTRENNTISGVRLGSLSKICTGAVTSQNNEYRDIKPSDVGARYLYSKGSVDAIFQNEKCYVTNSFGGEVESALWSDGLPTSDNVVYLDNEIIQEGGDLEATAVLFKMGPNGSTATTTNLAIDQGLTLPAVIASIDGDPFNTIEDANAEPEVTNMFLFTSGSPTLTTPYSIGTNNGPLFTIKTSDSLATIEGAGFFDDNAAYASLLKTGDVVLIEASNGTKLYNVTVDKTSRIITLSTGTEIV